MKKACLNYDPKSDPPARNNQITCPLLKTEIIAALTAKTERNVKFNCNGCGNAKSTTGQHTR